MLNEYTKDDPRLAKAREAHLAGKLDEALLLYQQMLTDDPNDPYLMFYIGTIFMQKDWHGIAINLLLRGLAENPNIPELYNNLGTCFKAQGDYVRSEIMFQKALMLREEADFLNNMATICINNGTPHKALEWCARVLELDPDHVQAHWNKGLAYLEQGKFAEGFDEYDWGFRTGGRMNKQFDCKPWEGEQVKGKLAVYGEQGIGDEIMFLSMVPDLLAKCDKLVLDVHPRLASTVKHSFPRATVYPTRKMEAVPWFYDEAPFAAKAALGSCAKYLRRDVSHFPRLPYLKPTPAADERVTERLRAIGNAGRNVGISWRGGTDKTNRAFRSIDLDQLTPVFNAMPDANIISLQYTPGADAEVAEYMEKRGRVIHHWQDVIDDFEQQIALVDHLDLVISVCTAVVHVAGAVCTPVYVLTPYRKAWRYYDPGNGRMVWYGSAKLYQQGETEGWGPVIQRLANDLEGVA